MTKPFDSGGLNRRHLLFGAAGAGTVALKAASEPLDFHAVRNAFPSVEGRAYFNCGGQHPIGTHTARAVEQHLQYCLRGPGAGRIAIDDKDVLEVKTLFGKLINAKPVEIGIVLSTLAGENIIVEGLDLARSGGNVVTDELHYHGGLHIYRSLQKAYGLEVRVVRQKDWRTSPADFERLIDRKTKLVALTLVSNINGHIADVKALSDLAHRNGAYLYADIVQAAGCIPMDVHAMGIDFAAAGTYKWMMGVSGMGFLYVREDLLDKLRTPHFGDGQYVNFEYHRFPGSPPGKDDVSYEERPGAARFEVGQLPFPALAGQRESLKYILGLGVENIQAHVQPLVQKIRTEIPRMGYPCISPAESRAPIAAFLAERPEQLAAKLRRANVEVKIKWRQMRITPSVFHNQQDVDRLFNALS